VKLSFFWLRTGRKVFLDFAVVDGVGEGMYAFGRVEGLLLEVGEPARFSHEEQAEEEACEVHHGVVPDGTVHVQRTLQLHFESEGQDRQVEKHAAGYESGSHISTDFSDVEQGDSAC